jgi:hypothetical protein
MVVVETWSKSMVPTRIARTGQMLSEIESVTCVASVHLFVQLQPSSPGVATRVARRVQ